MVTTGGNESQNGGASDGVPELSALEQWRAANTADVASTTSGTEGSTTYHPTYCACADCVAAAAQNGRDRHDRDRLFAKTEQSLSDVAAVSPAAAPASGPGALLSVSEAGAAGAQPTAGDVEMSSPGYTVTMTDDLIVEFVDGISDELITSVMNDIGATVLNGAGRDLQLWSVSVDVDIATAAIIDSGIATDVERNGIIENAVSSTQIQWMSAPDQLNLSASTIPNDQYYDRTWGMNAISAPNAWSRETGSSSVVVGVIDSGIDINHPDLINNLWVNTGEIWGDGIDNDGNGYVDDYHGYDFYRGRGIGPGYAYDDENGHGTHVAGTIAAQGNNTIGVAGVAWDAQLMAAKFLNASGGGSYFGAAAAIRYTVDNGARITNNSWGGTGDSSQVSSAISYARQAGQLFVAAAGNNGWDNDTYNAYPADYTYDNIISVAASTSSDARASFSNYGDISVDLAAPGYSIYSTYRGGGYRYLNGTSMASPHVAGAAALLLSADPTLTYTEIRNALLDNVDSSSYWSGLTATGGILNVDAALASLGPPPAICSPVSRTSTRDPATTRSPATHSTITSIPRTATTPSMAAMATTRRSAAMATTGCVAMAAMTGSMAAPATIR